MHLQSKTVLIFNSLTNSFKRSLLIIHNFSEHNYKLPVDGVLTPKHVGVILILILHNIFARVLVYNKHLSFKRYLVLANYIKKLTP